MADKVKDWIEQLATVGWIPFRTNDPSAQPVKLPCGAVMWVSGKYHGVDRDAWLGLDDGIVRLHGGSENDDCDVAEFVRRLTAPAVVAEKAEQGMLF